MIFIIAFHIISNVSVAVLRRRKCIPFVYVVVIFYITRIFQIQMELPHQVSLAACELVREVITTVNNEIKPLTQHPYLTIAGSSSVLGQVLKQENMWSKI